MHIEGMVDPVAGAQILAAWPRSPPAPTPTGRPAAPPGNAAPTRSPTSAPPPWPAKPAAATAPTPPTSPSPCPGNPPRRPHRPPPAVPTEAPTGTRPTPPTPTTNQARTAQRARPAQRALTARQSRTPRPARAPEWPRWLGPPPAAAAGDGEADRVSAVLAGLGDPLRPGGPARLSPRRTDLRRNRPPAGLRRRHNPGPARLPQPPLDIGRLSRVVSTALRRAVELRDKTCRFPGCDRPPNWCDCHHLRHWAHGGTTCLANLILLCGFHHSLVHEYGWRLHLAPRHRRCERHPARRQRLRPHPPPRPAHQPPCRTIPIGQNSRPVSSSGLVAVKCSAMVRIPASARCRGAASASRCPPIRCGHGLR